MYIVIEYFQFIITNVCRSKNPVGNQENRYKSIQHSDYLCIDGIYNGTYHLQNHTDLQTGSKRRNLILRTKFPNFTEWLNSRTPHSSSYIEVSVCRSDDAATARLSLQPSSHHSDITASKESTFMDHFYYFIVIAEPHATESCIPDRWGMTKGIG